MSVARTNDGARIPVLPAYVTVGGHAGHRDQVDLAGRAVDQAVELGDLDRTQLVHQTLDEPAMHPANEVRMGFGQRPERAVGEGHGGAIVVLDHLGIEPELGLFDDQGLERGGACGPAMGVGSALLASGVGQVLTVEPTSAPPPAAARP